METRSLPLEPELERLTRAECISLLGSVPIGRLCMLDAGDIIVRPVNFAIIGNELVIRSKSGRKLWAAAGNAVVFEVDGYSTDGSSGWSVLVKGRSHVITLGAEALGARRAQIPAWAFPQTASQFISVEMSEITGRRFSHPAAATDHAEPANPVPEPADASNVAS